MCIWCRWFDHFKYVSTYHNFISKHWDIYLRPPSCQGNIGEKCCCSRACSHRDCCQRACPHSSCCKRTCYKLGCCHNDCKSRCDIFASFWCTHQHVCRKLFGATELWRKFASPALWRQFNLTQEKCRQPRLYGRITATPPNCQVSQNGYVLPFQYEGYKCITPSPQLCVRCKEMIGKLTTLVFKTQGIPPVTLREVNRNCISHPISSRKIPTMDMH